MRGHGETETRGHREEERGDAEINGLLVVKWLRPKVEPEKPKLSCEAEFKQASSQRRK